MKKINPQLLALGLKPGKKICSRCKNQAINLKPKTPPKKTRSERRLSEAEDDGMVYEPQEAAAEALNTSSIRSS